MGTGTRASMRHTSLHLRIGVAICSCLRTSTINQIVHFVSLLLAHFALSVLLLFLFLPGPVNHLVIIYCLTFGSPYLVDMSYMITPHFRSETMSRLSEDDEHASTLDSSPSRAGSIASSNVSISQTQ
jgi:hypothetical protein